MEKAASCLLRTVILIFLVAAETLAVPPEFLSNRILARGQDFAIFENMAVTENGKVTTNRYTLLENGFHYWEEGQWKESQDIVEPFPGGAIARKGPETRFSETAANAFGTRIGAIVP